jgi:hypothetical protein
MASDFRGYGMGSEQGEPDPAPGEIGWSRRQFLIRTGTIGAAATVFGLPGFARAANPADVLFEDIASPALQALAHDTIAGLIVFQVPGMDQYSRAQGLISNSPGGIDADTQKLMMHALDDFLPVPDSYGQALAAGFTTAVSDIPIPANLLAQLGPAGEALGAQMDDALRAMLNNDAGVPLSIVIALMLNFLATSVQPTSLLGTIPTSPFASLSFDKKAEAFAALEGADADLLAVLDSNAPEPLKASLSGFLKFVGGALLEFATFLSYVEWQKLDTTTGKLSGRPVGWDLANYMPGETTSADGWDEFKGYFGGRKKKRTAKKYRHHRHHRHTGGHARA